MPRIGTGIGLGRASSSKGGEEVLLVAPTGDLVVEASGVGYLSYTASRPGRHYWALSAPATSPDAAAISSGTGALANGYFDAVVGAVTSTITFPNGINVTGGVFSVVARAEPSGPWSNVLRDTAVDVNTALPVTVQFVTSVENLTVAAGPSVSFSQFGTQEAGHYIVAVAMRGTATSGVPGGSIVAITPPSEARVDAALAAAVAGRASVAAHVKLFGVTLTAQRSGNWLLEMTSNQSIAVALYKASGPFQLVDDMVDTVSDASKAASLSTNTQAADAVIVALHNGNTVPPAATGVTSQNAVHTSLSNHKVQFRSGVALGGSPEVVHAQTIGASFGVGAIVGIAIRRPA